MSKKENSEEKLAERLQELRRELDELKSAEAERGQAEKRNAAFLDLGLRLSAARTKEEAARIITDLAGTLLGWDACSLDLYYAERDEVQAVLTIDTIDGKPTDVPPAYLDNRPSLMARRVIEGGAQLLLREDGEDTGDLIPFGDLARRSLSLLLVPIRSGERVMGVLSIQSYDRNNYDEEDLRTLQALADYCGGALERIRAEESLVESNQWLRLLTGQTPAIIWATDNNLRLTSVMGAGLALVGIEPNEDARQTVESKIEELDEEFVAIKAHRRALEGESSGYEFEWKGRTIQTSVEPLRNNNGEIIGVVGVGLDITERKSAEQSLAAEKERLAVTLGSISDGVIATDIEGTIIFVNGVAEKLTGWSQHEAAGRDINEVFLLVREKDRRRCDSPVETVLKRGRATIFTNHTLLIARDGTERVIGHSAAPIRDRDSREIGVVLAFRDITEQRKMEDELLKTSKLESLGVLAGGIAHDFNNLLTAMLGNISLAMNYMTGDERAREMLGLAEQACVRAKDLTRQLLTFARGGAPIKKVVPTSRFLEDAVSFAMMGSNARCEFDLPDELWPIEIDEAQIGQVLHNVARNAQEATAEGGAILVRAENVVVDEWRRALPIHPGDYVKIIIEDQGVGIPERNLSKIFDPYFTTKEGASGLGLATSYSIIRNHSGYIQIESKESAGTTVHIYLIASTQQAEEKREEQEKPRAAGGRILVMDDEELLRRLAREILTHFGYEAALANDGAEAVEMYREAKRAGKPFDAVIMDLTVPGGMGGKEAIKKLREIDPEVKAIVSSGYSNDPVLAYFKDYGFDGIVAKPYNIEDFIRALNQVLAGGRDS